MLHKIEEFDVGSLHLSFDPKGPIAGSPAKTGGNDTGRQSKTEQLRHSLKEGEASRNQCQLQLRRMRERADAAVRKIDDMLSEPLHLFN